MPDVARSLGLSKDVISSEGVISTSALERMSQEAVLPVSAEVVQLDTGAGGGGERRVKPIRIAVIDDQVLVRQCFAQSLEAAQDDTVVLCFSTIDEWQAAADQHATVSFILLCRTGRRAIDAPRDIEHLSKSASGIPIILISDEEDPQAIQTAIHAGARGVIPASVNLGLALIAMRLVSAGGIYVPECILPSPKLEPIKDANESKSQRRLTDRQAAIVEELRRGKPNKIIAYELGMTESTVKVHIRNIMQKLNARNRTEVAFIVSKAG
jgi:DNA-binding NarL/FixJ family response regulator